MKIRCEELADKPFLHTVLFLCLSRREQATEIHDCNNRKASGTDAQPGYEVAVLSGDWGSFTNKQVRAGITWALLANL